MLRNNHFRDDLPGYSNACGPICQAKKVKDEIERKAREAANRAADAARKAAAAAQAAKDKADAAAKNAAQQIGEAAKNAAEQAAAKAKADAERLKNAADKAIDHAKQAASKIKKGIKNLVGKALSGAKKLLKKAMLKRLAAGIRLNVQGIATRLYPAIITSDVSKGRKYKASFIPKARKSYLEILKEWTALGGKQAALNDVITKGSQIKFRKFSGVEGDDEDYVPDIPESEIESTPDYNSEVVTADEYSDLEDQNGEIDYEEKASAFKALWARILALFHKKDGAGDENPFEEGTTEAAEIVPMPYPVVNGEYPILDENGNVLVDNDGNLVYPSDLKILGIPKPIFWGGIIFIGVAGTVIALAKAGVFDKK